MVAGTSCAVVGAFGVGPGVGVDRDVEVVGQDCGVCRQGF